VTLSTPKRAFAEIDHDDRMRFWALSCRKHTAGTDINGLG